MKNLLLLLGLVALSYFYIKNDSAHSIAKDLSFDGNNITYNEEKYHTEWSINDINIQGYVRMIDSEYEKRMPIITTTFALTTGDYSDPTKVGIEKKNDSYMLYQLNPDQILTGTIRMFRMIPRDASAQTQLSSVNEGDSVSISAKTSTNGVLKGKSTTLKLGILSRNEHVPTKMGLGENNATNSQYILLVESASIL